MARPSGGLGALKVQEGKRGGGCEEVEVHAGASQGGAKESRCMFPMFTLFRCLLAA